jgi:hypothetical protein
VAALGAVMSLGHGPRAQQYIFIVCMYIIRKPLDPAATYGILLYALYGSVSRHRHNHIIILFTFPHKSRPAQPHTSLPASFCPLRDLLARVSVALRAARPTALPTPYVSELIPGGLHGPL